MSKNATLNKIMGSRMFWLSFSLLASILLWIYVTTTEQDITEKTFAGIQVEFKDEGTLRTAKGLLVTNVDSLSVSVTLKGSRWDISRLDSSDLRAIIDLSKTGHPSTMQWSYTIAYPSWLDGKNITVLVRSPEVISFTVDKLSSKTIEVVAEFTGSAEEGYIADQGNLRVTPSTVRITGAQEELDKIHRAQIVISRENISKTIDMNTGYTLVDEDGNPVDGKTVEMETEEVNVYMPVLFTKEVPLTVGLIDPGAAGTYAVYTFEPSMVTLAGDAGLLEGINEIVLGTVDMSSFVQSGEYEFPIVIPNDLKNVSGETQCKVKVEIKGLQTTSFTVSAIECINVPKGYTAELVTKSLEVMIRSTQETLSAMSASNIRAVADIGGTSAASGGTGSISVPVTIYIDGFTNAGAVFSYTVVVKLSADSG